MRLTSLVLMLAALMILRSALGEQRNHDEPTEATSLLGTPLKRPAIPPDRLGKLEADLANARAVYDAKPESEDAAIWYGRRLAYLGRYRESIDVFTAAIEQHPRSYKLLRHRGHRFITLRQLDRAVADLTRAAELSKGVPDALEPDGAPNARNIPRSTNLSNIWYHLALAHYLKGDFAQAAECWERCIEFARVNDDMLVATSYWLHLSHRRAEDDARAARVLDAIKSPMDVIENQAYHPLLLMFKGELSEDDVRRDAGGDAIADATVGYGIGVWKLLDDDTETARRQFARVLESSNWAAFGYIASEAELARAKE